MSTKLPLGKGSLSVPEPLPLRALTHLCGLKLGQRTEALRDLLIRHASSGSGLTLEVNFLSEKSEKN